MSDAKPPSVFQGGKEENMAKAIKEMELPNAVAQHYLTKPLLVNGFKFDMRIYALVRGLPDFLVLYLVNLSLTHCPHHWQRAVLDCMCSRK